MAITTTPDSVAGIRPGGSNRDLVAAKLGSRHRSELIFRSFGLGAILIGIALVALLFGSILRSGLPAFWQATLNLDVTFDEALLNIPKRPVQGSGESAAEHNAQVISWTRKMRAANWNRVIQNAIAKEIPAAADNARDAVGMVSSGERTKLWQLVEENPDIFGQTIRMHLVADANIDVWLKGNIDRNADQAQQQLSALKQQWADQLYERGVITMDFSSSLFTNVDSRSSPATAGLLGAIVGTIMMMLIVMCLAVPIGVFAACYLEEFAPKNRWTDLIEVNINNLAAVPSIVFGLLGASIFINTFHLPLSAPLVGGLVLTLMTLPIIIIASRASLRAVPPSIRQAALGVGASPMQAMFHHTLPLAVPGMLTGAIIGIAHAIGETAPLLLIGMKSFVASVPSTPFDQSTALSVQIYLWEGNELRNFFEGRTSAAIIVLLAVMILLNSVAIILRHRFERRW